jgi:hypothetical protein
MSAFAQHEIVIYRLNSNKEFSRHKKPGKEQLRQAFLQLFKIYFDDILCEFIIQSFAILY